MGTASAAADGSGGIDGAVEDMIHVWSPRYVTSNVLGSLSSF